MRFLRTLMITHFAVMFLLLFLPFVTSKKKSTKNMKTVCKEQTSGWNDCSKSCGMGLSTRVKTNTKCKLKRESRLCMIRPCDEVVIKPKSKKGKGRCNREIRQKKKEALVYAGATSVKKVKMKYCGACTDPNKCCTPSKTRTKKVWFKSRSRRKFSKKVSFVRKCSCHRSCPFTERTSVVRPFPSPIDNDNERKENHNALPGGATSKFS